MENTKINFARNCLIILISIFATAAIAQAGSLAPAASPAASGYTLADIYNRLNTNAAAGSHGFAPGVAPAGSFYTLSQIYNKIPTIDAATVLSGTSYLGIAGTYNAANLTADNVKSGMAFGVSSTGTLLPFGGTATPADVVAGKTFFGASQGDWNLQTGTLDVDATSTANWTYGDNDATQVLTTAQAGGSYSAVNLTPNNVRRDIVFGFNQVGTLDIGATSTYSYGDNDAANVLTIAAGRGTFDVTNLAAGTVKSGTAFGVSLTGQYPSASYPLPGGAGLDDIIAGEIPTGREAWTKSGTLITGNMTIGADVSGGNGVLHISIPDGYYSGKYTTASDSNLLQANIKNGITIFGITGNYTGTAGYTYGSNTSSGVLTTATGSPGTFSVANLANNLIKSGTTWGDNLGQAGTLLPDGGDAVAADVCSAKTFFGASQTDWNLKTGSLSIDASKMLSTATYCGVQGTIANCSSEGGNACYVNSGYWTATAGDNVSGGAGLLTFNIPNGYYSGKTATAVDGDLISANIKRGVNIFGVAGDDNVVDTSSGDAVASDLLSGKKAWVDGLEVTGNVTAGGNVAGSTLQMTIPDGLYAGSKTATASDMNLVNTNIKSGVTIFGTAGNLLPNGGTATAADVCSGLTAQLTGDWTLDSGTLAIDASKMLSIATYCGVQGTIATQTLSNLNDTVAAGYYAATDLHSVDSDLTSANIKKGITIFGIDGNGNVVDTSSGDAVAGDLLSGKKAWVDGLEVTGSIANCASEGGNACYANSGYWTASAGSDVTGGAGLLTFNIPNGYYSGKTATAVDADLASGNIRSGVNIFGVVGADTIQDISAANATSSQVLASNTFFSATGGIKTGTMTDNSAAGITITPGIATQTLPSSGYWTTAAGSVQVSGDANLVAANIKSGVSIFGTAGSFKSVLPDTGQTGTYTTTFGEDHNYTSANSAVCNRAASGADASFTKNADGTISDNCTNLEWKACGEGQTFADGNPPTCSGSASAISWESALAQCEGLNFGGHTDWRLPNVNELLSIVNYSTYSPSINATYFPATVSDRYWSSSTYANSTSNAWYVNFNVGNTSSYVKTFGNYVRCVRGQ